MEILSKFYFFGVNETVFGKWFVRRLKMKTLKDDISKINIIR